MPIYTAKSVVDEVECSGKVYDGVTIFWSCGNREHVLVPYSKAITDFESLGYSRARAAITMLGGYFDDEETRLLGSWLEGITSIFPCHRQFIVEQVELPFAASSWCPQADDYFPGEREISLSEASGDLLPKRLADLWISGEFHPDEASCKGYSLDERDRDLINRFSTGLADELDIDLAGVCEGVTSLCRSGFLVDDREQAAADELPF
jgi:hypothetical protein